jgi:nicotinamidase/pyrazinamidase
MANYNTPPQRKALGIIDVQNGFMPKSATDRAGFGELPVAKGEQIVPVINNLIKQARIGGLAIFSTQDWHPETTAHFDKDGGIWPVHCVAGTPGAELHPDLDTDGITRFKKGRAPLLRPTDRDLSYSGFYATNLSDQTLPSWLGQKDIQMVYLTGLAFDYCVAATALDLKRQFDVTVIEDATRPVDQATALEKRVELLNAGVRIVNAETAIKELL